MTFAGTCKLIRIGAYNKYLGEERLIFKIEVGDEKSKGSLTDALPEAIDRGLANEIKEYVAEPPEMLNNMAENGESNK